MEFSRQGNWSGCYFLLQWSLMWWSKQNQTWDCIYFFAIIWTALGWKPGWDRKYGSLTVCCSLVSCSILPALVMRSHNESHKVGGMGGSGEWMRKYLLGWGHHSLWYGPRDRADSSSWGHFLGIFRGSLLVPFVLKFPWPVSDLHPIQLDTVTSFFAMDIQW